MNVPAGWVPSDADLALAGEVCDYVARHCPNDRDRNRFHRVAGDLGKYVLSRRIMEVRLELRRD